MLQLIQNKLVLRRSNCSNAKVFAIRKSSVKKINYLNHKSVLSFQTMILNISWLCGDEVGKSEFSQVSYQKGIFVVGFLSLE